MSHQSGKYLAVFFADAHLDRGAWLNRPDLFGDSMHAFSYICNFAIKHRIPLFGAGDLIDVKKPSPEVVEFVRSRLAKLENAGCNFYFTQGQHEYSADLPWFCAIHAWPTWLNHKFVSIGSANVYGLDWRPADSVKTALSNIPEGVDILLCHQVWEDFMGQVTGCECAFSDVPVVDTIFTGDFHQNKLVKTIGKDGQRMLVISPGSTNLRKINEPVDKYFYVLKQDYTWGKVQIPTRRRFDIEVLNEAALAVFDETFEAAYQAALIDNQKLKLPAHLSKPLCRIDYLDSLTGAYDKIKTTTTDRVELFLKQIPPPTLEPQLVDRDTFSASSSNGLMGMVGAVVDKEHRVYKLLSRLLSPNVDLKAELLAIKKERGL